MPLSTPIREKPRRRQPVRRNAAQAGFSLVELSTVLVIIITIVYISVIGGVRMVESARRAQTVNKLDAIEQALMAFRVANNRLPCPADIALPSSDTNFGVESVNPGDCTDGGVATYDGNGNRPTVVVGVPTANYKSVAAHTSKIVEGTVPVVALNLPSEYMYDGWKHHIAYAVNAAATGINAMQEEGAADVGKIVVNDAGGGQRSNSALYALISFGADGHGGFLSGGARYSSGSSDADTLTNCHCTNAAVAGTYNALYVQKDLTQSFDDVVRFKERWQMPDGTYPSAPEFAGALCTLGFAAQGAAGDSAGTSVAVGDVNGDGIPDLIIGAPDGASGNGVVYVVFGTKNGFPNPLPLGNLNGSNGFSIVGANSGDLTGASVAVGDINGDGVADIVIGAPGANSNGGDVYVVFGGVAEKNGAPWPASVTLGTAFLNGGGTAVNGFALKGGSNEQFGSSVAAGDVNGDGIADIIVGAPGANSNAGYAYVIFGGATPHSTSGSWSATPTLANAAWLNTNIGAGLPVNGTRFDGDAGGDKAGWSVAVGDANGDGIADIVIGAPAANSAAGYTYLIYGHPPSYVWPTADTVLSIGAGNWVDGIKGERFDGVAGDASGTSVAVGDINGDGVGDVIIGAPATNSVPGSAYVIFGRGAGVGWPVIDSNFGHVSLDTSAAVPVINGVYGLRFGGAANGDAVGTSVAAADINGDGAADVIIGAPGANAGGGAGYTYVIFGGAARKGGAAWSNTNSLDPGAGSPVISGIDGFRLDGAAGDNAGTSVAAGDINGDGSADLIIGAPGNGSGAGGVYTGFARAPNATALSRAWPVTSGVGTLE